MENETLKEEVSLPREENSAEKQEKKKHHRLKAIWWLLISLAAVFVGAFFQNLFLTNAYQTDIIDFCIPTDNGQWVNGTTFKPKTATASNQAPCIVFVPGFQRTKESHYDLAMEFARRGYVCFIIDPYNQGDSSASLNSSSSSAEGGAYGAIPLVNYLYDTGNVNYIDKDQISIIGHSAGGNSAMTAAVYFSNLAGGVYENCKVKNVYVSGYIRNIIDVDVKTDEDGNTLFDPETGYVELGSNGVDWAGSKVASLDINVGFGYSDVDEGAWQNVNLTGDISRPDSYEALALITSGGHNLELRNTGLTPGKVYGQPSEGTMKVGYQEHCYHGMQPFDVPATSHIMYFLDMVYETDGKVAPTDQTWMWKQFFGLILMIGEFMLIFPLTELLLEIPFFQSVKIERETPNFPTSAKSWILFSITLLIGAVVACFCFVPAADLSKIMFQEAAAHKVTWCFPERMNNAVMVWSVICGVVGMAIFFISRLFTKKEEREDLHKSGVILSAKNFFKTLLLADLVWLGFYFVVHLVMYIFKVDGRFTFVAIRTTNFRYLVYELMYLPFFFIFYLSNSFRVNLSANTNYKGKNQFWGYALAVLANTLGLFTIFAIQYISIAVKGTMYWTTDWLYTNMLWLLIPMMFLLPIFQKIIYKKCNNPYLGAMINCLIMVTISMVNSVAHGPFSF